MTNVVVTGANGFVGRALCSELLHSGWQVTAAVRQLGCEISDVGPHKPKCIQISDLVVDADWRNVLVENESLIHLAARAHVMNEAASNALDAYRQVNVEGTERLARLAAEAGIRRFVFLSSIKVNGERTKSAPYTAFDLPDPENSYGISKWEAEQALWKIAAETGMEVVVVRSPLVYGPGVKANFLKLLNLVDKGIPLPLNAVRNRRSMIFLGNLVDALKLSATHPYAAGKIWLVSDGEDVSTPELIHNIAVAMGKPDRLWSVPPYWLHVAGKMVGRSVEVERVLGSLQIDSAPIRDELGWVPPYSMAQGVAETMRWYRSQHGG